MQREYIKTNHYALCEEYVKEWHRFDTNTTKYFMFRELQYEYCGVCTELRHNPRHFHAGAPSVTTNCHPHGLWKGKDTYTPARQTLPETQSGSQSTAGKSSQSYLAAKTHTTYHHSTLYNPTAPSATPNTTAQDHKYATQQMGVRPTSLSQ